MREKDIFLSDKAVNLKQPEMHKLVQDSINYNVY
jgi:hypothetical protein